MSQEPPKRRSPRDKARRTQAERSALTRERILDAAIAVLIERGYAGLTTVEVAKHARVSRGAQLHHFPTKEDLMAAAVEHLFKRRLDELERVVLDSPTGPPVDSVIDMLWAFTGSGTFHAWLEIAVAARTNPILNARIRELARPWHDRTQRMTQALLPNVDIAGLIGADVHDEGAREHAAEAAAVFAMSLIEGLNIRRIMGRDPALLEAALGLFKAAMRAVEQVSKQPKLDGTETPPSS